MAQCRAHTKSINLTSRGRSPRYPLDMSLGGPQDRSGRSSEENVPLHCGIELYRAVRSPVVTVTELPWIVMRKLA